MKGRAEERKKQGASRDRIIDRLMKGQHTVDALARELGLTKNAVRSQLARLQQEGIAEVRGMQKGNRRPFAVYGARAGADVRFSRAYPPVLSQLVRTLADRTPPREFDDIMRDTGARLAEAAPPLTGSARERIAGAAAYLRTLGSLAEVVEENGRIVLKSHGCPLSQTVHADVRTCLAMESMLHVMTGLRVAEQCEHGERPSCRFEFKLKKTEP